jgi:hypothetical protein
MQTQVSFWWILGVAALVALPVGGSVTASAQDPPPDLEEYARCMGDYNDQRGYCLSLGARTSINEACWAHEACRLGQCHDPKCFFAGNSCDREITQECQTKMFDDGFSFLFCASLILLQDQKIRGGDMCYPDELVACPGECRGCRGEQRWCGCNHYTDWQGTGGSLDCPAKECCSYGVVPEVCAPLTSAYSGWGRCWSFEYNHWTDCGFRGGYPFTNHCGRGDWTPAVGMCGWYADGHEGVDFILDYEWPGPPDENEHKYSCHFCKGTVHLEPRATSCDL